MTFHADPHSIAELLEEGEKQANERIRLEKEGKTRPAQDLDTPMSDDRPPRRETFDRREIFNRPRGSAASPRDPRRLTRPEDEDSGPGSKNQHKNRYTNEREDDGEHRARRSREHQDDDLSDRGSDKGSANGSVRSRPFNRRTRSRSPRSDGQRNHRSRERLAADRYVGSGRRSSDDDSAHWRPRQDNRRDRDRDRPRSRDRDSYHRRDDRDQPRGGGGRDRGGRDNYRRSPGDRRPKTPEPTDDERDRRTVFVQQLAARIRTKILTDFFKDAGLPVVDAQVVKDRVTKKTKGVAYVEFETEEAVQRALQLTGQKIMGVPVIVQQTEAEKNRQAKTTEGAPTQSNGIPFHRLYVGNIHFSITEDDLRSVFESFGELEFVQLQKEEAGRSKGYGFVQFINPTEAKDALEKMNGFELAGRPIRVGLGNDKFTPESTQSLLQRFGPQGQPQSQGQGSSFSGMGGRGVHAGGTGNYDRPGHRNVDKVGAASALDDSDVAGVNFSNVSRYELMYKLARDEDGKPQKPPAKTQPKKPVIEEPTPSRCVLIKNAYDQNKQSDPNWQQSLKDDMKAECELKYGRVLHIGLLLSNNEGEVYVKFAETNGGLKAYQGLNGRNFDQRTLTAQFLVDAVYNSNFPKAANLS